MFLLLTEASQVMTSPKSASEMVPGAMVKLNGQSGRASWSGIGAFTVGARFSATRTQVSDSIMMAECTLPCLKSSSVAQAVWISLCTPRMFHCCFLRHMKVSQRNAMKTRQAKASPSYGERVDNVLNPSPGSTTGCTGKHWLTDGHEV